MDSVVVLSGGSGGAKLARGSPTCERLTVVANTADDVDIYGVHVSPDPDLVTYGGRRDRRARLGTEG